MPIQSIIRKAITDHLVNHVNVGDDKRCRIDILCEQAEREIMKEMQVVIHMDSTQSEILDRAFEKSLISEPTRPNRK
jgi:CRISPR/Cas system-associated protein Cas10 (large subunit of type III CRISPR-Cas system)